MVHPGVIPLRHRALNSAPLSLLFQFPSGKITSGPLTFRFNQRDPCGSDTAPASCDLPVSGPALATWLTGATARAGAVRGAEVTATNLSGDAVVFLGTKTTPSPNFKERLLEPSLQKGSEHFCGVARVRMSLLKVNHVIHSAASMAPQNGWGRGGQGKTPPWLVIPHVWWFS